MANTVTLKTVLDGERKYVGEIDILGDGTGEETATVGVDFSTLTSPGRAAAYAIDIDRIIWSFTGFSAVLLWDATTDVRFFECNENTGGFDFTEVGGALVNPKDSGYTGDIVFSTSGLGSGDHGFIRIEGSKR